MAHQDEAVLSYLMGKSSLVECLTHFPGLAERLSFATSAAEWYEMERSMGPFQAAPGEIIDHLPPAGPPDLEPKGRGILAIVAAASARNGFKDHLIYIDGHTLWRHHGLSDLCTDTLKCTFVAPGTYQIHAKTLLIDSIVSKTPRLESNVVQIEAQDERPVFLTLHRTDDGLLLETGIQALLGLPE